MVSQHSVYRGDAIDKGVMARKPWPVDAQFIDGPFRRSMLFTGALTGGVALAVFIVMLQRKLPGLCIHHIGDF
jgi:hypothetical protein